MRAGKSVSELHSGGDHGIYWHRSSMQALCEAFALQKLEDDVLSTVLDSDVMDNTDVWMLQRGARTSLSQHSISLVAVCQRVTKDFESHVTRQANVQGFVDLAHATTAN